jgi:hypothetical protein
LHVRKPTARRSLSHRVNASAVITDKGQKASDAVPGLLATADLNLGGPGMSEYIADRFLENPQHIECAGGVEPGQRRAGLHAPTHLNTRAPKIGGQPVAQIADQGDEIALHGLQ